jgi:exoribonuclease II
VSHLHAQSTAPSRSADVIEAEIQTAHDKFKQVVQDPSDISDETRRKAIAPRLIPLLKTMVADYAELATVEPTMNRRAGQVELQFDGFLSVLGDQPTIDHLTAMASSKNINQSLRGQSSQLLARWVLAGKDETAQTKIADDIDLLDHAHPESEDLTFLTITTSQSTLSKALQNRLLVLAQGMKNPIAERIRKATGATTRP